MHKMQSNQRTFQSVRKLAWGLMVIQILALGVGGQEYDQYDDEEPPCDLDRANSCFSNAVNSIEPSGCNWFIIIGPLYQCIDESVEGCTYREQEESYASVTALNDTIKNDSCSASCTNHPDHESRTLACFDMLEFASLVNQISQDSTIDSSSSQCSSLAAFDACIKDATTGCNGLIAYSYDRINSTQGAQAAYMRCQLGAYQPATTNAPLPVFNTLPPPTGAPPLSTTNNTGLNGGDVWGIVLGGILLIIIILILALLICYCVRKNRQAKSRSILKDWRPNGQHVYRDEPQWIRQEKIDFRGANEGGRVYKPSQLTRTVEDPQPREVYFNQDVVFHH